MHERANLQVFTLRDQEIAEFRGYEDSAYCRGLHHQASGLCAFRQ